MKTYVIGYDLHRPGQDYALLFEALKSYKIYWHCLDSTWLIHTSQSAAEVRDYLVQYIDRNDSLMVARLSGEAAWQGFSAEGSAWLKQQLEAA